MAPSSELGSSPQKQVKWRHRAAAQIPFAHARHYCSGESGDKPRSFGFRSQGLKI